MCSSKKDVMAVEATHDTGRAVNPWIRGGTSIMYQSEQDYFLPPAA